MQNVIFLSLFLVFLTPVFAFSTTNIEYLYGSFDGNSGFDTEGGKSTITVENFSTFSYGDFFGFVDLARANDRFKNADKKSEVYFELSPRVSFSKVLGKELAFFFVKDIFLAGQYNRQIHKFDDYHAQLYGAGFDLKVKGFDIFGLNFYKKEQNFGGHTYQLSANYISNHIFSTPLVIDGFLDWTTGDFLTQNRLLYDFNYKVFGAKTYAGTEWHYYRVKDSDIKSNVFQFMVMMKW